VPLENYTVRCPHPVDLTRCYEIESTAYEGDEAATRAKIQKRIATYPQGFMVIEIDGLITGFINSGSTDHIQMADEDFKELIGHTPDGRHNVILSVAVHPDYQGQGLCSILMANYVLRMHRLKKESIHLMCRQRHIGLYEKLGFKYLRKSESSHGKLTWHEMVLRL
jgi:ribosomal protein S18 acetylase RimI-like enzyme